MRATWDIGRSSEPGRHTPKKLKGKIDTKAHAGRKRGRRRGNNEGKAEGHSDRLKHSGNDAALTRIWFWRNSVSSSPTVNSHSILPVKSSRLNWSLAL